MKPVTRSQKRTLVLAFALLLFVIGSACALTLPRVSQAGATPPAPVTQEVTQVVTVDVTREATRIIDVPVTLTPTAPPVETPTPEGTPAMTGTLEHPVVTLLETSDCRYGPADFFLYKTSLAAGALMEAVGRSPDGTWMEVQALHDWDPCWVPSARFGEQAGLLQSLPVVIPSLPTSYWYKPPSATAHRDGSTVTVAWKAISMTPEDYRGYLIIAWVCQGGEYVYLPVSIMPPYAGNTGILSTTITDEKGCPQASQATIYTAEKRGYFGEIIFWPPN